MIAVRSCRDAAEWDALLARVPWAVPQQVFGFGRALVGCFGYLAGRLVGARRPCLRIPFSVALAAAQVTTPVARLLRRPPPLTPGRLRLFVADRHIVIDKALEGLGFTPEHQDLEEMLGRTHQWYTRTGQL